jgi:integrase
MQTSVGTTTQGFGGTDGAKRRYRCPGHINLSPQEVSYVLPLLKAADGLFKRVEYIHHLPKTLQVAEQEGDVERTQHDAGDCNGPVNFDRCWCHLRTVLVDIAPGIWLWRVSPRRSLKWPGFERALTARAVARLAASLNLEGISHHVLRHTGATVMVAAGVSLRAVQTIGGWSSLRMVERYAHVDDAELVRAVRITQQHTEAATQTVTATIATGGNVDPKR